MPKVKPITQPLPLAKMALQAIRDSILNGNLVPGELYNEMTLARELGISRTPVREALLELSAQGLVTYLPRKGVMVNHFERHDVEEIFELRKAIELATVEKVAKHRDANDLSAIEKALNNQKKAFKRKDPKTYLHFDRLFHVTLAQLTNNRRFADIIENIRDIFQLIARQALSRESRWQEVIKEHERILDAIKQGDAISAREAMNDHLDRSKTTVLEKFDSDSERQSPTSGLKNP